MQFEGVFLTERQDFPRAEENSSTVLRLNLPNDSILHDVSVVQSVSDSGFDIPR